MSFNTKLVNLLKTDPRFVNDEGELVVTAVQDRAWKLDRDLVKLLLSDKDIKDKFLDEIEGHWIFNTNTFLDYICQKNFLDNSYTRFRNRIGLTINDKFLRERGEVALTWPYKDCVLEGGQTKEEDKRKEIFFNEVLAEDEINRLLDPKVLTNFVRYTAKGKEKVTDFKRDENGVIRENLILKGNNLLALHTLKHQFRGQVKLIYIDPPYNTENDTFGYNDSFNHSTWLTFMRNRLEVAGELLKENGVVFVSCDDNEQAYLKVLCDEMFKRENFIQNFMWLHGKGKKDRWSRTLQQYILCYAKNKKSLEPWSILSYAHYEFSNPDNDPRGPWFSGSISFSEERSNKKHPNYFEITSPSGIVWRRQWQRTKEEMGELLREKKIFFGLPSKYNAVPRLKIFPEDVDEQIPPNIIDNVESTREAQKKLDKMFGEKVFDYPKPVSLMKHIVKLASDENAIILDFMAGTGTTAQAVLELNEENGSNRQFILCEQLEDQIDILLRRLAKVVHDQTSMSKSANWRGGFIYCELMKYNQAFIERIQDAKSSDELLQIWREMAEGSFLNWYVNPEMPEEAIKDFMALGNEAGGLGKQKHLLAELLDKNQLYVNLTEMDDAQFKVSREDKALNRAFYGEAYNA